MEKTYTLAFHLPEFNYIYMQTKKEKRKKEKGKKREGRKKNLWGRGLVSTSHPIHWAHILARTGGDGGKGRQACAVTSISVTLRALIMPGSCFVITVSESKYFLCPITNKIFYLLNNWENIKLFKRWCKTWLYCTYWEILCWCPVFSVKQKTNLD